MDFSWHFDSETKQNWPKIDFLEILSKILTNINLEFWQKIDFLEILS